MKKYFILLAMIFCMIFANVSSAQEPEQDQQAEQVTIQLDFPNTPITTVIEMISQYTNKNFMFDDKVSGKITIISPKKVTVDEAYKVLLSILDIKGFAVIESDNIVKIIPKQEAKSRNIETYTKIDEFEADDNFITQLIPLNYVSATSLQTGIRQIVSREGVVFSYPESNTLVIIDTATNVERVVKITKELDIPGFAMVYNVIQIKYALASDIVRELSSIFAGTARKRPPKPGQPPSVAKASFKMIADDRTNSLVVFADEDTIKEIKYIIEKLDIEVPKGESKINVYYLKYANAEEIAEVLSKFSQEAKKTSARYKPKPPPRPGVKTQQSQKRDIKSGKLMIEGDVTITADKATNSLIIMASPSDYEILKGVIEKLDIMRIQVLVEAFIIEISLDKEKELGIEWRSTSDFTKGDTAVMGGTNFGTINTISTNPLAAPSGLMLGMVKGTITFAGKEFLNIGALMRALETESGINVMSRPHILTMDYEEAEINVVENIPYKTSEKYDTNGNPIFTYDYKDVGVVLKLTPQVMESSFVKLKIDQEISQVVKSTQGIEATAPTTSKRLAKTTVFVKDNEMVVIGGLIKDNEIDSESKVPCLGDLPFFGMLFRAKSTKIQKTDLLVFLTPHIIREPGQLKDISSQKKDELKKFEKDETFEEFNEFKGDKEKDTDTDK